MNAGDPSFISGFSSESRGFILRAGSAIGVEKGSQFQIYPNNNNTTKDSKNLLIGTLVADQVGAFQSVLKVSPESPSFTVPSIFFAKTTLVAFDIFTEMKFRNDIETLLREYLPLERSAIHLHEKPQTADIKLEIDKNQLIFHRCSEIDKGVSDILGTTKIPYSLPVNDFELVSRAFKAIAHFNRQLRALPPNEAANTAVSSAEPDAYRNLISKPFGKAIRLGSRLLNNSSRASSPVSLQFFEVNTVQRGFEYVFERKGKDLVQGDTVDLVVDPDPDQEKHYGVVIHSNLKGRDLYAYLFYFDASTFEIGKTSIASSNN